MRSFLTEAIKRRILHEMRKFWSQHPEYRETLVPNIQDRYSFDARPCDSIILKGVSGSPYQFSADNFVGHVKSYCSLMRVGTHPGTSIEWVTENRLAIMQNNGVLPSAPGIYYIGVEYEDMDLGGRTRNVPVFYVSPVLDVIDQAPVKTAPLEYTVINGSFVEGTERVFELPGNIPYVEGINYDADPANGTITLARDLPSGTSLSVDYRYEGPTTGPYLIKPNFTNVEAIPGVNLAFGRFVQEGDIMAVIVGDRREIVAREYGGRWELSLNFDIMSTDVNRAGEITDRTATWLWGVMRNHLSEEGIEVISISIGGETEEVRDENADDYFYGNSISMDVQTDWSIHVPAPAKLKRLLPTTKAQSESVAGLTDDELVVDGGINNLKAVQNLALVEMDDPFFAGRARTFETIK